ncbi:hypothetical protein ABEG18_05720 [Alsobacter sp. KACC 23698]|uniref:Uncharacterized protein n=1 Tax=Alsobacter sp. KACC 23698 TaxID=3149229 RepID=A0AAU7JJF6_9HYPH
MSVDLGRTEDAAALRFSSMAQSVEACHALAPRIAAALGRAWGAGD